MASETRPSLSIRRLTGRATDRLNEKLLSSSEVVAGVGLVVALLTLGFAIWFRIELSYQSGIGAPLARSSAVMNAAINESVAALRGWVAYGQPESRAERIRIWQEKIVPTQARLRMLTDASGSASAIQSVAEMRDLLGELEVVQWAIEDVARTPGNEPTTVAYETLLRPLRTNILRSLQGAMDGYRMSPGEKSIDFVTELARFQSAFTRADRALSDYVQHQDKSRLPAMDQHLGRARHAARVIEDAASQYTSGDLYGVLEFTLDEFGAYDLRVRDIVNLEISTVWTVAQSLYLDAAVPLVVRASDIAGELAESQAQSMAKDSQALTTASAVVIAMAVLMGLLSGGSLLVSFRLQRQVLSIVKRAKKLGQYEIERRIGMGGMGEVYLARHAMLRRPTAIKLLRADSARDARARNRFQQEVQLTSQLTHPNTIEIFDYGRTPEGIFYYAMEYIDGFSLDALVSLAGPVPPPRVISTLLQACGSLQEAHERGLLHRDVKPSNIMLTRRGGLYDTVKILDFGLVRDLSTDGAALEREEDMIAGTPMYLAPESILSSRSASPQSDLYALGAVAYYLLTGTTVFPRGEIADILARQLEDEIPFPSERIGHALPEDLEYVVMGCLAKDPADRPPSAAHLASLLHACKCAAWTQEDARLWWEEYGEAARKQSPVDTAVAGSGVGSGLEVLVDASRD